VEERLVCGLVQRLNSHKTTGLDGIHSRVLRDIVARPLFIIFEKRWRSEDIPADWERADVISTCKEGPKRGPRKLQPH